MELTGKEAALWAVSGTQGNQICLRTHLTQPPHSVLLDHRAHVHCWESGALPVISQAVSNTVRPKNGMHLTLEDVKANMIADGNSKCLICKLGYFKAIAPLVWTNVSFRYSSLSANPGGLP